MSRMLGARRWAVLLLVALVAASCTDDGDEQPAPTTQPNPVTTVVDRSGIALAGVRGETTTTLVERGAAVIGGGVQGPGGLVPGATVRIERIVAGREIRTDVVSGPDGRYSLSGVPGGRYRLRAFMAPTLVQLEPEVRFLADDEEHTIDLRVEQQGGLVVRADVAPEPPIAGEAVNLVAAVRTRTVSSEGVVTTAPVVGVAVELQGLGRWELRSSLLPVTTSTTRPFPRPTTTVTSAPAATTATARTDGNGQVRFELLCTTPGAPGLALRIPVASLAPAATDPTAPATPPAATTRTVALDLPECAPAPATTTSTPSTTTATSRASTSTTSP